LIKKRTAGGQQQGRRPFNAQRRNYTSVYDNMSYGAFSQQSNASSYNPRGGLKFGFRGGNRGGYRKFTPGFRGGRGFGRGGSYAGSQRGDNFSENSSNFSRGGFRGGFGGCNYYS